MVSERPSRDAHGSLIERDGFIDRTGPVEMHGYLRRDRIELVAVHLRQRVRHLEMKPLPPDWAKRLVGDVTDQVVAEVVGVRPSFSDNTTPPQLVETEQDVTVTCDAAHLLDRERPPDHGGRRYELARSFGQHVQAGFDDRLHSRWERRRPTPRATTGQLDQKQRITVRQLGHPVPERRIAAHSQEVLGERCCSIPVEPTKRDLNDGVERLKPRDERAEWVTGTDLAVSHRTDEHQACCRLEPHQEVEELQCLDIAPLEIVNDEGEHLSGLGERPSERFEQPPPRRIIAVPLRRGRFHLINQLGKDPGDMASRRGVEAIQMRSDGVAA